MVAGFSVIERILSQGGGVGSGCGLVCGEDEIRSLRWKKLINNCEITRDRNKPQTLFDCFCYKLFSLLLVFIRIVRTCSQKNWL